MNYTNLFYTALCSLVLLICHPVLQWVNTSFYFGIKKLDDYISVMPGFSDPGCTRFIRRNPNVLKTILKYMRTQICFYSKNSIEIPVTTFPNPGGISPPSYIDVQGIPNGSVINGASLWWEGSIRNSIGPTNDLLTGYMCVFAGTSGTSVLVDISDMFKLGPSKCSKHRFTISDVSTAFDGNKTYTVRFQNMRSAVAALFLYGSWVLEVDFEMP